MKQGYFLHDSELKSLINALSLFSASPDFFSLAFKHLHKKPFLSEIREATSLAGINQHDFNEISVLKLTDTS